MACDNVHMIAVAIALIYLVVRYFFARDLDALHAYASYVFEVFVVAGSAYLGRKELKGIIKLPKAVFSVAAAFLIAGFAAYKIAGFSGILIPFDFSGAETLIFLLIVAPILEEGLFRFVIWRGLGKWKNTNAGIVAMASVFAYSHFHAYFFLPESIVPFVQYQTLFTFILALPCGWAVTKKKSLPGAIAIHFAFNLGFFLASKI